MSRPAERRRRTYTVGQRTGACAVWLFSVGMCWGGLVAAVVFLAATLFGAWAGIRPASTAIFRFMPGGAHLVWLDAALPLGIMSCAFVGCLLSWGFRFLPGRLARRWQRSEIVAGRWFGRYGLLLSVVAVWFSLATVWSQMPRVTHSHDQTEYSALLGHIPWSDARGYYNGAEYVTATGTIDEWNQRRPLNVALFAARLAAVDFRPNAAMLLQGILLAVALYLAADAAGARYGVRTGMAAFAMLLGYAKLFFATTLSETLGVTLGALGAALLVQSLQRQRIWPAAAGSFGVALALCARAGAMFLLPSLVLWAIWHFGGATRRRLAAGAGVAIAIVAAFGVNGALGRLYGTGQNSFGSNFALTLCGLTEGTDWSAVYAKYGEQLAAWNEGEQARFLYARSWENVRSDPMVLATSLWKSEKQYVQLYPRFQRTLTSLSVPASPSWTRKFNRWNFATYACLTCGVAMAWWRRRRAGDYRLGAMLAAGILASAPFVFQDGGWRVFAATWPLLVMVLSTGFASPSVRPFVVAASQAAGQTVAVRRMRRWLLQPATLAVTLLGGAATAALAGPALAHWLAARPAADAIAACRGADKTLVRPWSRCAAVAIVDEDQQAPAGLPTVTRAQFERLIDRGVQENIADLRPLPPTPFIIAAAFDFTERLKCVILYGVADDCAETYHVVTTPPNRARVYYFPFRDATPVACLRPRNDAQTDLRQLRR